MPSQEMNSTGARTMDGGNHCVFLLVFFRGRFGFSPPSLRMSVSWICTLICFFLRCLSVRAEKGGREGICALSVGLK